MAAHATNFIDGMQVRIAIGGRFDMQSSTASPPAAEPEPEPEPEQLGPMDGHEADEGSVVRCAKLLKVCSGKGKDMPTVERLDKALRAYPGSESRQTESGFTALHYLCNNPHATHDLIKALLNANAAAAAVQNSWGEFPLHILCRNQDVGETCFGYDSELGAHAAAVRLLLDACPLAAAAMDLYGDKPLHWIVRNSAASVDAIEIILDGYPRAAGEADSKGEALISTIQEKYSVLADKFRASSDKYTGTATVKKGREKMRAEMDVPEEGRDLDIAGARNNTQAGRH
jgi:hypothetical protein